MEWLKIAKEVIVYLYYISGIILSVGIVIAALQLRTMKKDSEDRNKRAAVQKSIDYLDWFASKFIPDYSQLLEDLKGEKFMVYHKLDKKTFNLVDLVKGTKDRDKLTDSIKLKFDNGAMNLANTLEFFSAAIISGLAEEELAYNPVSSIFCEFVEFNYDMYCYSRRDNTNSFSYTIKLYELWKGKLHNEKVDKQLEELNKSKVQYSIPKIIGE